MRKLSLINQGYLDGKEGRGIKCDHPRTSALFQKYFMGWQMGCGERAKQKENTNKVAGEAEKGQQ